MAYEDDLKKVWIFSQLEREDLERMGKVVVPRSYKSGETIVKEGEQAVAFYVIVKGKVEIKKGEVSLATLKGGDCFGEMALLDGYPRATSVVATEDTECLGLTRWDFTAELKQSNSIALAMLPIMSKRIRELEEKNEELMAKAG